MKKNEEQLYNSRYFKEYYDSKERFTSYWHQINEIIKCEPKAVLEVGVGNGFVADYLKKRGIKVTTCDIDKALNPDIVCSVLELPFSDEQFDVVACYEVLEHIPYENVYKAINELTRVSSYKVIISVPDRSRMLSYLIQIPKMGKKYFQLSLPTLKKKYHEFDGEHHWELGKKDYPHERFKEVILKYGLIIENSYRVFEHPLHRFFVCRKKRLRQ